MHDITEKYGLRLENVVVAMLSSSTVTFPNLREGVLSVNSQIGSLKTFLSKRSFGNNSFVKGK